MTGIMCALVGAGSGSSIYAGSSTVTVGNRYEPDPIFGTFYGYQSGLYGSISPTTWASTGATVNGLYYVYYSDINVNAVNFVVSSTIANSGWTTLSIGGVAYTRASASYSTGGGGTTWSWSTDGVGTNPFGTTVGATKAIVWS